MHQLVQPADERNDLDPILGALRSLCSSGAPLPPERALAGQLNVKRHQLRRALEVLRASGEIGPASRRRAEAATLRRETIVRSTNPIEVIELRLALEPALARLAALRASPFDIERIERAATTAPGMDSGAADLAFHKTVAASTRNSLAEALYGLLREIGTDARVRLGANRPACPKRIAQRDAEHRVVAAAIATRDPDAAERAMRAHLTAVQKQIMDRLAPDAA